MAAGTYELSRINQPGGTPMFRLGEAAGPRAVLLVPAGSRDAQKSWEASGTPVLFFECGSSRCSLAQIWTGGYTPAYAMRHVNIGKDELLRVALIEMRR